MPGIFLSNPTVTTLILWLLTIAVVGLLAVISWGVKNALDRLVLTIDGLIAKQQQMELELERQVTTCEVCRLSCPQRRKGDKKDD